MTPALDAMEVDASALPAPRAIERAEWSAPLALFIALALAACGSAILGLSAIGPEKSLDADSLYGALPEDVVPVHNDPTPVVLDLPRDLAFARGLHAGRLDAWNPSVGCGAPLWAEQGGPFFPLKLPFYLAPSRATHHLFLALRLIFAALGAFFLGRRRGQSLAAATLSGALFELSGALFAHLSFAAASAVYMLPWALLGAQLLAMASDTRERARVTAFAAIALGITANGGHPTLIVMVFAAFALGVLGHAMLLARSATGVRVALVTLGCAAIAGLLGLAIAAPALLPLAELASVGRSYKDTDSGQRIWLADLGRFRHTLPIALFAPQLLRSLGAQIDTLFPYMFAPVLGVLGLLLGLAGLLTGSIGPSLLLPMLLGIALAVAPPGLGWVHRLPLMRLIMPQYPWSLVALPMCLAAGHLVDARSDADNRRARIALVIAAALVLLGAVSLRWVADDPVAHVRYRHLLLSAVASRAGRARYYVPLVGAAASGFCAGLFPRVPARKISLALGVLALFELAFIILPATRLPPSSTLRRPESDPVRFLSQRMSAEGSRMMGMPFKVGHPNTAMMYGLDDVREVSALPVRRYVDYLTAVARPVGFTVQAVERFRSPLLDMAAMRWVVVRRVAAPPEPFLGRDQGMPLRWRDDHVAIYENAGALPRFRVTHSMVHAATEALAQLYVVSLANSGGFAHADAAVAIEPDAHGDYPAPLSATPVDPGESVRRLDSGDPDRLQLEARLDRDGLVIVADTVYPGWSATIDGQPTSIYPADMLFRAVRVPAGVHQIEMRYRPRSLRIGFALCLFGLLAALTIARFGRARPIASAR